MNPFIFSLHLQSSSSISKPLTLFAEPNNSTPTPSISKEGRRLSNHLAAPWAAGIVGDFRQVFGGDVTVIHVHEGTVDIGKPTELTDVEIVSIPVKAKGKKEFPPVQFTIARAA